MWIEVMNFTVICVVSFFLQASMKRLGLGFVEMTPKPQTLNPEPKTLNPNPRPQTLTVGRGLEAWHLIGTEPWIRTSFLEGSGLRV